MSSSWTERKVQSKELRSHSLAELQDMLLRQERILSNNRLLQTLPDKGKKIKDFAESVRLAIKQHEEEEKRQSLVSAARAELQSKYQQDFTYQQHALSTTPASLHQNRQNEDSTGDVVQERETSHLTTDVQDNSTLDKQQGPCISRAAPVETMETAAAEVCLNSDEKELTQALDRVTLSEMGKSKEQLISKAQDSYFIGKQQPKSPHYITVLNRAESYSTTRRQKFKPNMLSRNYTSPSGSLSPSLSSEGSSPLSAQARRERDRKHLDDITAAKLPPLNHSPAQLLSLEESVILLREQSKRQQELQAKLAAQKLSEGLKISMGSYTPDGGPMAAYREVHDEGAQLSSEED